jgi:uncharacterized protein YbjQ (UPF0145 family)
MIIVTSEAIANKRVVKTLGLVRGNSVRARHIGKDIMAGLRNIVARPLIFPEQATETGDH